MYLSDYVAYDESLAYIGPCEGWTRDKEYWPTWIPVEGLLSPNSNGSSRKAAALRCAVGAPVYLFWEEEHPQDLTAVAVFYFDPRRDSFSGENQIGYLPPEVAQKCIPEFIADEKRFGATVKKIFTSETGNMELYLELTAFLQPEQRKKHPNKQSENCAKWRTSCVKTFLSMCTSLAPNVILALEKADMLDHVKLTQTRNPELMKISGITREALAILRKHYPFSLKPANK